MSRRLAPPKDASQDQTPPAARFQRFPWILEPFSQRHCPLSGLPLCAACPLSGPRDKGRFPPFLPMLDYWRSERFEDWRFDDGARVWATDSIAEAGQRV